MVLLDPLTLCAIIACIMVITFIPLTVSFYITLLANPKMPFYHLLSQCVVYCLWIEMILFPFFFFFFIQYLFQ